MRGFAWSWVVVEREENGGEGGGLRYLGKITMNRGRNVRMRKRKKGERRREGEGEGE